MKKRFSKKLAVYKPNNLSSTYVLPLKLLFIDNYLFKKHIYTL